MTIYAVSFRIKAEPSPLGSYDQRWQSVDLAIKALALNPNRYWKETTSFFILQCSLDASTKVAQAIHDTSSFDTGRDLVLVINLDTKAHAVMGVNPDKDLETIMALRTK